MVDDEEYLFLEQSVQHQAASSVRVAAVFNIYYTSESAMEDSAEGTFRLAATEHCNIERWLLITDLQLGVLTQGQGHHVV